jgi:hypothetical protein
MESNNFSEKTAGIRNNLIKTELIEVPLLAFVLGLAFGVLGILITPSGERGVSDFTMGLIQIPILAAVVALALWAVYLAYIRMARAGGKVIDVAIWIIAAVVTASFTFWCWIILDLNRVVVSKLLYKGEAPVEYAWSAKSKAIRKAWESSRKAQMSVQPVVDMPVVDVEEI